MNLKSMLCLLILIASTGCAPSPPTPAVEPLSDQLETNQIQLSPTTIKLPPTWTSTPTSPPTRTATITLTPTPEPTNTPRPTREATATRIVDESLRVSLATVKLRLSDLPPGFTELPMDDYMRNMMLYQQVDFDIATFAAFIDEQSETAVMSMIFVFADENSLKEFDQSLGDVPDELDEFGDGLDLLSDMGIEIEIMDDFQAVGNKSMAFRMILSVEEETIHYEIAMFRRGPIGASVFVLGTDALPETPDLQSLAELLDQRIIEAFPEDV